MTFSSRVGFSGAGEFFGAVKIRLHFRFPVGGQYARTSLDGKPQPIQFLLRSCETRFSDSGFLFHAGNIRIPATRFYLVPKQWTAPPGRLSGTWSVIVIRVRTEEEWWHFVRNHPTSCVL